MNSSTPNTEPAESPKTSTEELRAIEAHRRFSDQLAREAVEGLRRLAQQKARRH